MATEWEEFSFWYAKSLTENTEDKQTEIKLKLTNSSKIKLRYIRPSQFAKRITDTSNAQAQDKKAPDTGNAVNQVEIQIAYDRQEGDQAVTPLKTLLNMWFLRGNDTEFRDGRFGLLSKDNPELNADPVVNGGYRIMNFEQLPNSDSQGVQVFNIQIQFLGDHSILGAFS